MFCKDCGTEVKEGSGFCYKCGRSLIINQQTPSKKPLNKLFLVIPILAIGMFICVCAGIFLWRDLARGGVLAPLVGERLPGTRPLEILPYYDDIGAGELATTAPFTPTVTATPVPTPTPLTATATPMSTPAQAPEPLDSQPIFECRDAIGCVAIAPDQPIHIASLLTVSGVTEFLGIDSRGGIELAISDRGGQLLGRSIRLTEEDSRCSAEGGRAAAARIVADPTIVGVIGSNCSSAAITALPIISGAGLIMISPSNTAPSLTDPDETWHPGYFRTAHNDFLQARMAAEFAYTQLGARTVATIHDGSPYSDQLQQMFGNSFANLGGNILFQEGIFIGQTDMRDALTRIGAAEPDALYFPIFEPEGVYVALQAREIPGLANTVFLGADGLLVQSFPINAGAAAEGMFLTGLSVPDSLAYRQFLARWQMQFGGAPPSAFHAHAYDATNILLNAIEQVAEEDIDGSLYIGRQTLREAVAATADFQGLTGVLTCAQFGDCASGEALAVFQITMNEIARGGWPPPTVWRVP